MQSPATRILALGVALVLLGGLSLAAWLQPDPHGLGTHLQIDTGPFSMHECAFLVSTGHPCATCGMTTSFAHAAEGNLLASFIAQPFGWLLAMGSASGFWIALHVAITGSNAAVPLVGLTRPRALWILAGLLAAAWAYKLLVTPPA